MLDENELFPAYPCALQHYGQPGSALEIWRQFGKRAMK
jgi:hypothetical protein